MKIQMAMNQKKKMSMDHRISPKVVVASTPIRTPLALRRRPPCGTGAAGYYLVGTDLHIVQKARLWRTG
jgi:hypothetical protein